MTELPEGFLLGVATSSYQIEGGADADGRGESIWDQFSHMPGRIAGDDTGDVAADHYHRSSEDVGLIARAGLDAYRFSISWPRVFPRGDGRVNSCGLDFYDRLVDDLLDHGIEPWACLFHWDLPRRLQSLGGWASRDTVGRFGDYALTVGSRLADRVRTWLPVNEPSIFALLGHWVGAHAPGLRDRDACFAASHHLNVATSVASEALRSTAADLHIGNALALNWLEPATDSAGDRDATTRRDAFMNRAFLDPFFSTSYPEEIEPLLRPWVLDDDMQRCEGCLDFVGVNYYTGQRIAARTGAKLLDSVVARIPDSASTTAMGWEIWPDGLRHQLLRLRDDYPDAPLYVTENGAAFEDEVSASSRIHDSDRIDYLERHLGACLEAIDAGADLRGYFVWSLLDNFEWAEGYSKRFGVVHVDFETLDRNPRSSYDWLRRLATERCL